MEVGPKCPFDDFASDNLDRDDNKQNRAFSQQRVINYCQCSEIKIIDVVDQSFQINGNLVLLRHRFWRDIRTGIGVAQHGHRARVAASANIIRRRIVAITLTILDIKNDHWNNGSIGLGRRSLGKFYSFSFNPKIR